MSATWASGLSASASITSRGFCHASRSGSSNTRAHLCASAKLWSCLCGVCAAARAASKLTASTQARILAIGVRLMSAMEKEKRPWSQHVANLSRAAFWLVLLAIVLSQVFGGRGVEKRRASVLGQFEEERKSRVIAMIHRQ